MGGVYYAATQAEAQLCAGDPVVIVGGGNSAGQAAMFLSKHAESCRLLIRGDDLGKSMSRYLVDQIERNEKVKVCRHTEVVELDGDRELETITVEDKRTGERSTHPAKALFVFIGASPHTEWLDGQLATDDAGFLLTGRDVEDLSEYSGDRPLFLETCRPGDLRRRRCPLGVDQASRVGGGRGIDGGQAGPRAPRRPKLRGRRSNDAHLHTPRSDPDHAAPRVRRGLRGVPDGRRSMAASADLPRVREGRVL